MPGSGPRERSAPGGAGRLGRVGGARGAACRASGFTVIELLVVIAIIMILAAMALPMLAKAQAKARRALCVSNLREVGKALYMYSNNADGVFPSKYNVAGPCDLRPLYPQYTQELAVFGCPAAINRRFRSGEAASFSRSSGSCEARTLRAWRRSLSAIASRLRQYSCGSKGWKVRSTTICSQR